MTVSYSIGDVDLGYALCDLGTSINFMALSISKKFVIGKAQPTTIVLQLVDRSIAGLEGKIEDVLVKMDKFIFLIDFIIPDYDANWEVPIILG